ncbi:MAG TPA: hypothetical protein VF766_08260 [Pyrinomonadaceae bacterium]
MQVKNYANLSPKQLAAIESELPEQHTLLDVINWGLGKESGASLPNIVAEVIVQDEFTHDTIVPWRDNLVLVYDTT